VEKIKFYLVQSLGFVKDPCRMV